MYLYQKGDYESMRKDTLEFAKEKYFNGQSDTRSVQENFDLQLTRKRIKKIHASCTLEELTLKTLKALNTLE